MLIGITGTDGAGKGTVVRHLVTNKSFVHCSARAIWEEEIKRRKIESNRPNMRLVANELRAKHGNDFLIVYYLNQLGQQNPVNAIIESIRTVAEAETLKANGGVLLAIDADQRVRYGRIFKRGSSSDRITFEEFVAQENLEMDDPDPNGMQKAKVLMMADYTISNSDSIEELQKSIDDFLTKYTPV